ncbi:mannitol dehydrogenase family protein [Nonomuraea turcica]|uniref:mannitol dehydrogenase family protein n=1 Tax=Nonomuraea sp. G32 TaxID=3067274 RepID=UPI00273B0069|nr:mannitol dehydrogenase family protein [Nonomuraea sp. G32]MDP4503289.1 mannitol dehydrogenase family protein [Nonomuraea sp. G32]
MGYAELSLATLDRVDEARRPRVDPRLLRPRIVHVGLGAFHRAHQALSTEEAAARSGEPWGIAAVAPRSAATVEAMRAQDCLYTVTDRAPGPLRPRVAGAIVEALLMRADGARLRDLLRSEEVPVVTLTVTEKAYHRRADVVGRLAGGLAGRYRHGGAPISVVSCDNLAGNGRVLATVVRDFVAASPWPDRERLLDWMEASVAFPDTVVDRIVPATTPGDQREVSAALGLRDAVPVLGEPYRQWVLEDRFAAMRPPWELGGAVFVADVTPYQLRKLRLLNGAHSAMAYLGSAAGCRTVAEVLETGWGERFVRAFGAEVAATLPGPAAEAAAYVDQLVERFRNPELRHLLRQIGSDGSAKIPERWFDPLRALRPAPMLELALAAWVNATGPDGLSFGMTDPQAQALAGCHRGAAGPGEVVARLLRLTGAPDLAERADLTAAVAAHLPALRAGRVDV